MPTRTRKPVTMSAEAESPLQAPSSPVETREPLTGDIDDPPVPEGTTDALEAFAGMPATVPALPEGLLPLAHGFCQYLQAKLDKELTDSGIKMARVVENSVLDMSKFTQGVLATNEHAQYSFADALVKFAQVSQPLPYRLALQAHTPQGYPVTLTIEKSSAEELIPAMGKLGEWLHAHGYTV
jgi:hypothetical protein